MIHLKIKNIYTKIESDDVSAISQLRRDLSEKPKGYKHSARFKNGLWDGNVCFLEKGRVLTGLLPRLIFFIEKNKYKYTIEDLRKDPLKEIKPIKLNNVELREYQWKALEAIIREKRGVVDAATNAGKTIIASGVIQALGLKTLFLTHREELFTQTEESFENALGRKIGQIWGTRNDLDQDVVIAMVPTLHRKLIHPFDAKKKKVAKIKSLEKELAKITEIKFVTAEIQEKIESLKNKVIMAQSRLQDFELKIPDEVKKWDKLADYLQSVEVIIVDETHHSVAATYEDILLSCSNAYYRIGLSGTPFAYEDLTKTFKSIGLIGYAIYEISNKELIDQGVSSQPHINMYKVTKPIHAENYQDAYKFGIVHNEERNNILFNKTKEFYDQKLPTLVIVNLEEHGQYLKDYFIKRGLVEEDVQFISGNSKRKKHRKEYMDKFKDGNLPILISSLIVQEGISMNSIGALVFALGGKSETRVLQCLGRGLRQNKFGNVVEVVDFIDATDKYLLEHSLNRFDTYSEEGFGEFLKSESIYEECGDLLRAILIKHKKRGK